MDAVDEVNHHQKHVMIHKIEEYFRGDLKDKTVAVWGLAFKPRTDDIREAPALVLIDRMLELGANVQVHDPEATDNVRAIYGDKIKYASQPVDALEGADALSINTEWSEYHHPNFSEVKQRMNEPTVFDGRNLYEPEQMREEGFTYYSIGRLPVFAEKE
jgi:UDPglucose 6-dehydrogenase